MRLRTLAFVLAALAGAALFARLGLWQLARLHERQGRNAIIRARLAAAPVSVDSLQGSSDSLRYRRARVSGVPDYDAEMLLVQRTHDGSPGVFLLTPVRTGRGDSATVVVRGWVYAPDGMTADRARWRDGDSITAEGWLDDLPRVAGAAPLPGHPEMLRTIDQGPLQARTRYPLRGTYLWATGIATPPRGADAPARFPLPVLDDGPHRSYAIQWFSFATIALVGAGLVVRSDRGTQHSTEREPAIPVTRS